MDGEWDGFDLHLGLGPHILVSCNIKYPQNETLVQYWIYQFAVQY